MSRRLLVVPTAQGVGLTSVCLGIVRALDRLGVPFAFVKPISQSEGRDRSSALVRLVTSLQPPDSIPQEEAERLLGLGDEDVLMEHVVERIQRAAGDAQVLVIEGLATTPRATYSTRVNAAMAQALDAELVLVGRPLHPDPVRVADAIDIAARAYGEAVSDSQRSCILNRVPEAPGAGTKNKKKLSTAALGTTAGRTRRFKALKDRAQDRPFHAALEAEGLHPLGIIPSTDELTAVRMVDVATQLRADVINEGAWRERRVHHVALCAATVANSCKAFQAGALLIAPGDREDIFVGACLAAMEGIPIAGLLLTGGQRPHPRVMKLCRHALASGLPVLSVPGGSYDTAAAVHDMNLKVPIDDQPRAEMVADAVANHLDAEWLKEIAGSSREQRLSAAAFRHQLIELAHRANKRIVLPEGDEPRTVAAAAICAERGIARCVLLAPPAAVERVAAQQGLTLPDSVEVIDPASITARYVEPLVELRRHKGLTSEGATEQLQDTVVLGTMMLKLGEVDGLVSGAVHTTANTIRPALQLIKTAPGQSLVSSVFFMCLPEQVLVYGDCAVNPDPNAEQLAEIALQSAISARAFGVEARVAMISYSTGSSGSGQGVEKVTRATQLARERDPQLAIDGPLQYDAASQPDVAKKKAPNSPVAGRATVFVFPDLNTGNTTYKAVQRSAQVISMGPMLQGLAKPVNDLSRGALVDDIVFTIALTAIQAAHSEG
jgi:phosphate acetyltransferase